VRLLLQQRIFDRARRARREVAQLGALGHIDARQVEHAHAAPPGVEQRCAGAAVARVVLEKVLAAVQPYGLLLGQRRAYGRGAHGRLGQVYAHPPDGTGAWVAVRGLAVQALHCKHDAARVGQQRKVAHAGDGARELLEHRAGCLQQVVVLLVDAAQCGGAHGVEHHALRRLQAAG